MKQKACLLPLLLFLLSLTVLSACAAEAPQGIRNARSDICIWQQLSWEQMSTDEHALWSHLGWDVVKWENETPSLRPNALQKPWAELDHVQRSAAESLGYNQEKWDIPACGQ